MARTALVILLAMASTGCQATVNCGTDKPHHSAFGDFHYGETQITELD